MYSKNINIFDDQYYTWYVKKSMLYLYIILYSLILIKICTKENNIAVYLLSGVCNSCLKKSHMVHFSYCKSFVKTTQ